MSQKNLASPAVPTLTSTVNDVLRAHPATMSVLNAFAVDLCCGGGLTLEAAARDAGVEPQTLLRSIHDHIALADADPTLAGVTSWGVA
jgi:iron-sulfur cluster repair protein YtfE (RIC family)